MTFDWICRGLTPAEREQMAWFLGQYRARKTFEALRKARFAEGEPSQKRCFSYCGDEICDCELSPRYLSPPPPRTPHDTDNG